MKPFVVLAVLAALVAVATSSALARTARPNEPAACTKGAVARIGGKAVCLHARMARKAGYNRIYKKHGFTCVGGHLRKTPKPPAPAPTPPEAPYTPPPAPAPTPPEAPYTPPTGPVGTANTTVTVEMFDETDTKFVLSQNTM